VTAVTDSQPRLSVIVVTHSSRAAVARTLPALASEMRPGDELIVVDNASGDGTPELVGELVPDATLIETGANLGYGEACNRGARAAGGELLLMLNPDAVPAPGFREAIARPLVEGRGWAAWQGLVTADRGRTVNTSGGVVHFTGVAWAGQAGEPLAAAEVVAGEPGFLSGACLAIERDRFLAAGGYAADFFLYHEDVELSLRLRLEGAALGVEPAARVDHEYEFEKGPVKWRRLERNRWATLVRTYPAPLLLLLAPALAATELAILAAATIGGWLPQKLGAWWDSARALPGWLRERRTIQRRRSIAVGEFAAPLAAELSSAYLGAAARSRLLAALLRGYWRLVLGLLRVPADDRGRLR
jgi:GT2 family glycosyltransferase